VDLECVTAFHDLKPPATADSEPRRGRGRVSGEFGGGSIVFV
jgi:hypothetical protein